MRKKLTKEGEAKIRVCERKDEKLGGNEGKGIGKLSKWEVEGNECSRNKMK